MTYRTALALTAVCAAASTFAQSSSVTLYGVVDLNVTHIRGNGSGARTLVDSNGLDQPRLGFKSREDLGDGLFAEVVLESTLFPDQGTGAGSNTNNQPGGAIAAGGLTFSRRATVSLVTPWGELRLGRDYAPTFSNQARFDPFIASGISQALNLTLGPAGVVGVRVSNALFYLLPANAGGFYGAMGVAWGENAANATDAAGRSIRRDGRYWGARLGWGGGPFDVAAAVGQVDYAAGDIQIANIGAWYDLGVAKPMLLVNQVKVSSVSPNTSRTVLAGVQVPVGVGQFRFSAGRVTPSNGTGAATQLAAGYVHHLSKRTALYGNAARLSNGRNTRFGLTVQSSGVPITPDATLSGVQLGIRHFF